MSIEAVDIIKQSIVTSKISKIIAKEALAVEFSDSATTASFDLDQRILTLPYNINMSDEDIRTLFMFHEVSHALFTPLKLVLDSNELGIKSAVNIVEDIRCERLIKARYPATAKSFISGYRKLLERGFFGKNISIMNFASRLNVYAKVGMSIASDVHFTKNEYDFYQRCYSAETPEEVLELSKELALMNYNSVDLSHVMDDLRINFEEEQESLFDDDDEDEEDEDSNGGGAGFGEMITFEQMLENLKKEQEEFDSNEFFYSKFEEGNVSNCKVETYKSSSISKFIPYKQTLEIAKLDKYNIDNLPFQENKIREKREDFKRSVDYMARQFESKKAAYRSKNAKISNTGMLNTSRVFAYKISDEIFKQKTTLADAKNHGFVILLDTSGSICNQWFNMVDQVILLTEYFRMIKVPYKVFTFGQRFFVDRFGNEDKPTLRTNFEQNNLRSSFVSNFGSEYYPAEFLTSEQSNGEHNKMCAILRRMIGFGFGGTPTMSALTLLEAPMAEFFQKRGIHKRKVIVITDGEPGDVERDYHNTKKSVVCFDPLTKKSYQHETIRNYYDAFKKVFLLGKILKDRYDIDFIGMGICSSLAKFYGNFMGGGLLEEDRKSFNRDLFLKKKDPNFGVDAFFIKPKEIDVDFEEMSISSEKSAKQNSKALIKTMKGLGKSRVLLNALNEALAI